MKREIAVSVIVPIYNVEPYLRECIESILAQSLTEIEIILVDDGGADECPSICDYYAAQDIRIKVIHQANGGLISARQAGAALAKGNYIGFVDGDDVIDREFYKTLYYAAKEEDADIVCGGYTILKNGNKTPVMEPCVGSGVYHRKEIESEIFPHLICEDVTFGRTIDSVCTKLFRRGIFCKYGASMPKELGTWEDFGFSKAAMLSSHKVVLLEYAGYYYRQSETSMSHSYIKGYRDQVLHAYRFLLNIAKQENAPEIIFEQLERYRIYYAGAEAIFREYSPKSPNGFQAICNLCKEIYGCETILLTLNGGHWLKKLAFAIYRMRNPWCTAAIVIFIRELIRLKQKLNKYRFWKSV